MQNQTSPRSLPLTTHNFSCLACKHKWKVDSEDSNVNHVFPNFCPNCGAKKTEGKLQWEFTPPATNKENQRKANRSASMEAVAMAHDFAKDNPQEEMVTIHGKPSQYAPGGVVQVPKKTVDTLEESMTE